MEMKISKENQEKVRERVLLLIEAEFGSDAAFERTMGLPQKTVNNWRRAKSASYMKMLPEISEKFGVNIGELLDIPVRRDTSELSDDEVRLLRSYRRTRTLPKELRDALCQTLDEVIDLYVLSAQKLRDSKHRSVKRAQSTDGGAIEQ